MTNTLKVKYVERSKLIPYVNNARTHSESQVKQIAASIKEFGFTNPILVDEDNGIIAGHGRLLAAEILELAKVPTITLSGLTDEQRRAYIIADNKLALNAGWDFELLQIELEKLPDFTITGFSETEINQILGLNDKDAGNSEIDINDFEFDHECPRCNFQFND